MLSSILQQRERKKGKGLPEISVKVAYVAGTRTQLVCNLFYKAGLSVLGRGYPSIDRFQFRGLVRNDDLKQTQADWVLFADSDMVYPPDFFGILGHLLRTEYRDSQKCLFSQRQSTYFEPTEELINQYEYPCVIPAVWEKAKSLEAILKKNIGAGYCQIANVENLKKNHGGFFVKEENCNDKKWSKGQKARTDIQFRHMLEGEAIPLPVQVHLQHLRGKPEERDF